MFFVLYFVVIIFCLFILYAVSRHDFVLLRQSISLRQVFDNAFLSLLAFFLTSRIFYSLYVHSIEILNPLRFFYLTKYWGILPFAGFAGMIVSLLFLFRKKKNKLRILDIYIISFSPLMLLDVLLKTNTGILLPIKIISALVLFGFYAWFIKIHNKFSTKDGFITFLAVITYSIVSLAFSFARFGLYSTSYLWINLVFVLTIIAATVLLVLVQKNIFNKK